MSDVPPPSDPTTPQPVTPEPESPSSGGTNTAMMIGLGVLAVLIGAGIIWLLVGGNNDDDETDGGATTEEIEAGQTALAAVGCYTGGVDGEYGSATEQAVRDFQAASGLTVDGIFGPDTQDAIQAALASGTTVCTGEDSATTTTAKAAGTTAAPSTSTPVATAKTVGYTTSTGTDQTLDLVNCEVGDGDALRITAKTETSDLSVDFDGEAGSMTFTSADGDQKGIVDSVSGSSTMPTVEGTLTSSDGTDTEGSFGVTADCS